ncbi:hypothetical protein NKG05_24030 [Oerskovia sp. M15]
MVGAGPARRGPPTVGPHGPRTSWSRRDCPVSLPGRSSGQPRRLAVRRAPRARPDEVPADRGMLRADRGSRAGHARAFSARRRRSSLRDVWPEVVDHLSSGVRAGLSLPEAVGQLGERGPAELRAPFAQFAQDFRATGRFGDCLDALRCGSPIRSRTGSSRRCA